MSLDFYLMSPGLVEEDCECSCGFMHTRKAKLTYFSSNITHNLGRMFDAAGVYQILWHGDGMTASEVVERLRAGLALMLADPARFRALNAENGWGTYENAVPWLREIIEARLEHPTAMIECST